jgi:3-oxoadipate enol-lactonase
VNDVQLSHRIDGPDDAPWLVLSNSLGASLEMWDRNVPELAERFRVLRYDQRGHGRSPVPPGEYSIDDFGRDVIALMDQLGIERASFCGVSLGGMTGMWLAGEFPDRIDRLVAACTSAHLGPPSMWEERIAAVREGGVEALADATLGRWLTEDADAQTVEFLRGLLVATPRDGYAAGSAAVRDMDLRERLGRIEAPTLVIAADKDLSTPPEHGRAIADAIPGARLVVLENARHLANVERPAEFNRAVIEHVAGGGA